MGKSLGTKPSGRGPGLQKRGKLSRKYLTDPKAKVKKGSMADLDFGVRLCFLGKHKKCGPVALTVEVAGVEQAPKLSREEATTGLKVPPRVTHARTYARTRTWSGM